MADSQSTLIKLELCTSDGTVIGALPDFELHLKKWEHVAPIVSQVKKIHCIDVVILRLLDVSRQQDGKKTFSYLAEKKNGKLSNQPRDTKIKDHPGWPDYARPGGSAEDLHWAFTLMKKKNIRGTGQPIQHRTGVKSSVWRIPSDHGWLWLKVLPSRAIPEGDVLQYLKDFPVPRVIGHCRNRLLLEQITGGNSTVDRLHKLSTMVQIHVQIQKHCAAHVSDLLGLGLPDWRRDQAKKLIAAVICRNSAQLDKFDRFQLKKFGDTLDARFAELDDCGLHDTLLHGDLGVENIRGRANFLTILDFADSFIGHPFYDLPILLRQIHTDYRNTVSEKWISEWRDIAPQSNPRRAAYLIAPLSMAQQAAKAQSKLDTLEPHIQRIFRTPKVFLGLVASLVREENIKTTKRHFITVIKRRAAIRS